MKQLRNFGDQRHTTLCAFCAGTIETRDHVPPKVFLDEPYPENLPVVPACNRCNEGSSLDEEYVVCLVECALAGSANPDHIQRERVKQILTKRPALASRLASARYETPFGGTSFTIDLMTKKQRDCFETRPESMTLRNIGIWPEVGSRAMQRIVTGESWLVVQPGRYRYLASVEDGIFVRIVLSEYLGCEVGWTST